MTLSQSAIDAGMRVLSDIWPEDPRDGDYPDPEDVQAIYEAMSHTIEEEKRAKHANNENWHHESYYIPGICTMSYEFIIDTYVSN